MEFIEKNPQLFLETKWVQIAQLRAFLESRASSRYIPFALGSSPPEPSPFPGPTHQIRQTRVKCEPSLPSISVKAENLDDSYLDLTVASPDRIQFDPHEIIEISSDEDEDAMLTCSTSDFDTDFETIPDTDILTDADTDGSYWASSDGGYDIDMDSLSEEGEDAGTGGKMPEPTDWGDEEVQSRVIYSGAPISITRQLSVTRVELLQSLPSLWVVPLEPTAFIIDARGPDFAFEENGKLVTVDRLIKDKVSAPYFSF